MKGAIYLVFLVLTSVGIAQNATIPYYLPDINYDENITTPEEYFGFQPGDWHIDPANLVGYLKVLEKESPRLFLMEIGRSWEQRPLVVMIATSEKNHSNLEQIRRDHGQLCDPLRSGDVDISNLPIVIYQGFSIHGNEASGANAAPLVAYYLAAGLSPDLEAMLDEMVILLDPCFNPDGLNRFAAWVNSRKSTSLVSDPQSIEFEECWPGGRTNHYWFDLNRDWLPSQQPESQARLPVFHKWKPNILTDHHEMGTDATFFFQPGIPQRTNPLTPGKNQDLTREIAKFHAEALNAIGSMYYSEESFDDFYYGKGSTYPDVNGAVGILFEQASARGHLQESENGPLSFSFAIRNQVATALSTQRAARLLRKEMLDYQREFYLDAIEEAGRETSTAYVFSGGNDPARAGHFIELLQRHEIEIFGLKNSIRENGKEFPKEESYVVPLRQPQYKLIKSIFDTTTAFRDSIFYDISTWTLPLAFNLDYEVSKRSIKELSGDKLGTVVLKNEKRLPAFSSYAYLLDWRGFYAPKALNYLMRHNLRTKVATRDFEMMGKAYPKGTILIPVTSQEKTVAEVYDLIKMASKEPGVVIEEVHTGLTETGIDLGSPSFQPVRFPQCMMITGESTSPYNAGEVWHLLDQRFGMKLSMTDISGFNRLDLTRYNCIIMAGGSYSRLSSSDAKLLQDWAKNGGTLVALEDALHWAKNNDLAEIEFKEEKKKEDEAAERRPYEKLEADRASQRISGAIFEGMLDLSHPLAFGYENDKLPLFRTESFFIQPAKNPYATPVVYSEKPLLSGYISEKNLEQIAGTAAITVTGKGKGRVICFADNPNFRAFWFGTNKLFMNAIFFGSLINGRAAE